MQALLKPPLLFHFLLLLLDVYVRNYKNYFCFIKQLTTMENDLHERELNLFGANWKRDHQAMVNTLRLVLSRLLLLVMVALLLELFRKWCSCIDGAQLKNIILLGQLRTTSF